MNAGSAKIPREPIYLGSGEYSGQGKEILEIIS
jgi:hypothetical protein